MRLVLALLVIFGVIGGGFAAFWFSPTQTATRDIRAFFSEMTETVDTQDRAKISQFLNQHITDDAAMKLDVVMTVLAITGTEGPRSVQNFNKKNFIPFIDNLAYSTDHYGAYGELDDVKVSDDKTIATASYRMKVAATGASNIIGSSVKARWVADSGCTGDFALEEPIKIKSFTCNTKLAQQPDITSSSMGDIYKQFQKP